MRLKMKREERLKRDLETRVKMKRREAEERLKRPVPSLIWEQVSVPQRRKREKHREWEN